MSTKISATVVADSVNIQGDRLTSVLVTMPRIIIAEMNTHRMLSKNTSSSRAIPFNKMVEAVQNDPFIPITWQKDHKGMQGSEYITDEIATQNLNNQWLQGRDSAIKTAKSLNRGAYILETSKDENGNNMRGFTCVDIPNTQVTKQLCNRLLEPFMWTTMLITGSKEGWDNFHSLRNSVYEYKEDVFNSKKDAIKSYTFEKGFEEDKKYLESLTDLDWLKLNKGQAEIHMMALAECIWDAVNESTPKQLKASEWHLPMLPDEAKNLSLQEQLNWCVGIHANTSYTVVGDGRKLTLEHSTKIHDKCKEENHSSVFEHCAKAMSDEEYYSSIKTSKYPIIIPKNDEDREINGGVVNCELYPQHLEYGKNIDKTMYGWCRNFKGFIPYRYMIDNKINL